MLIVIDDVDLVDIGAYDPSAADVQTPRLDALARQGVRFTRCYANASMCSPNRASMLTGDFPARFGISRPLRPQSRRGIPPDVQTLAEKLRELGYHTGHVGKWHVGDQKGKSLPPRQGFGCSVRSFPPTLLANYFSFTLDIDDDLGCFDSAAPSGYLTTALTDYACAFIQDAVANAREPFFLNLWHFAPHVPLHCPPAENDPNLPPCSDLSSDREKFVAMLAKTDRQIDRIFSMLETLAPNTLVIVASDNGGGRKVHVEGEDLPEDSRPLRGFKQGVFDGGLRIPMFAWGDAVVAPGLPRPVDGFVNDSLVASFDVYTTLIEVAGGDPAQLQAPGRSFLDRLVDPTLNAPLHTRLFWEITMSATPPNVLPADGIFNRCAAREGDWKLVRDFDPNNAVPVTYLFDMGVDEGEENDLTAAHPDIVDRLRAQYHRWRHEVGGIAYDVEFPAGGVTHAGDLLMFADPNAVAIIPPDSRFDVSDGHFTFLTWITPQTVSGTQVLAEKEGGWRLTLDDGGAGGGILSLDVDVSALNSTPACDVTEHLSSGPQPRLAAGTACHVGFTVLGWEARGLTIRLYVDGQEVDLLTSACGSTPTGVAPEEPNQPTPISLGNAASRDAPFLGEMQLPLLSVLSLYPCEITATRNGSAECVADADGDVDVDLDDLTTLLIEFGLIGEGLRADVDADGDVDLDDLTIMLRDFGAVCFQECRAL